MRERDLHKMFVKAANLRKIAVYKTASVANRGFFDLTLIGPGRRLGFVELKGPRGELTRHQQVFLDQVRPTGVFYRVLFASLDRARVAQLVEGALDSYMALELYHPEYRPL